MPDIDTSLDRWGRGPLTREFHRRAGIATGLSRDALAIAAAECMAATDREWARFAGDRLFALIAGIVADEVAKATDRLEAEVAELRLARLHLRDEVAELRQRLDKAAEVVRDERSWIRKRLAEKGAR